MNIEKMRPDHWPSVKRIYQEGIDTGDATFQESPPSSWQEWADGHFANCSLVCLDDQGVVGWAAISPVSQRSVYQGAGEVSVYVTESYQGMGVGEMLLKELIKISEQAGIRTLQAGIFPENKNSLHLHKKLGFVEVGVRNKIGKMSYGHLSGTWRDVVLLEKRSKNIGTS
ncbi:MAG: N-acetyltransferase family protein [Anaerolineales bacterium]|nr:N-acetyltransferase family protein [Anaerolineales bacterium]